MTETTLDDIMADSGPIEPHLAALAGAVDLPDAAVSWCALHIDEAAPALRAVLAQAADGTTLSDDQALLLLRGLFILGGQRDAATFPILMRFLRRPEEELERLLGDALVLGLPKILSGTFDGDADALLALACDAGCIEAVRCSALEAAAFLTFDGRIARERMRTWLSDFATSRPTRKGDLAWVIWSNAVARLAFRDLCPLVEAALADGRISKAMMRKRHFEKMLAAAEADPEDASRFEDASYISDILEALEWTSVGGASSTGDGSMQSAEDARIELHLAALGKEQPFPEVSLRACVARLDEAGPALRQLLDRAAAGRPLDDDESLRLFRGLFVLAAARDTTACASLLRFLRRPPEETEALLGDADTMSLPRLLVSLFDGDAEALFAVVADASLDGFLRGSTLEAAVYLAWEGRICREALRAFLAAFYRLRPAADESYVWYAWMQAVALLNYDDLVPLVEAAWKARRIDHSIQEWSDFKMDLARARTAWNDVERFASARLGYADDAVTELAWTRHWGNETDENDAWEPPPSDAPIVNPFRDVGRNDPCPCGSGKKYKKCCLAAA